MKDVPILALTLCALCSLPSAGSPLPKGGASPNDPANDPANDPLPAPTNPNGEDPWAELDRELGVLGRAQHGRDISSFGAVVRAFYSFSDADIATLGAEDLSGFAVDDVDMYYEVGQGDFFGRIQFDLSSGNAVLEDAYATMWVTHQARITVGQFKVPVLRSNTIDPERLAFKDRTVLGTLFDEWQVGAMFAYVDDLFGLWAAQTNGDNGQVSDSRTSVRAEVVSYESGAPLIEGSHGASEYLLMTIGAAYVNDNTGPDRDTIWGGDVAMSMGPYSAAAEWMDFDDGAGESFSQRIANLTLDGNSKPWSLTFGTLLADDWQALVRGQWLDDTADTQVYSFALNHFPNEGPVSWVLDVTNYDREGPDGVIFSVGVNVGLSRRLRIGNELY